MKGFYIKIETVKMKFLKVSCTNHEHDSFSDNSKAVE